MYHEFADIVCEFEYVGENKRYESSWVSSIKNYKMGDIVDIYYDPKEDRIYEKGNNDKLKKLLWGAYIFVAIAIVLAIFMK